MDRRFEPYFATRVQQIGPEGLAGLTPLSGPGQPNAFEAAVFNAVARGYGNFGPDNIRPDAELLLQLAFREFLALPVLAVRGQVDGDLLGAIEGDTRTITQNALDARESSEPISMHAIVNATSRSWPELRTAGFEVWD